MTNTQLNNLVKKYMELKAQADGIEAQMELIKKNLKEELKDRGVDEVNTGKYVARNQPFTRTTLDSKKFKKEQPAVYAQYAVTNTTERFTCAKVVIDEATTPITTTAVAHTA